MKARREKERLDGLSYTLERNVEVRLEGRSGVRGSRQCMQLDIVPGHEKEQVLVLVSRYGVSRGGCEDAGENPVGLVGKGADQLAGAQPPQLGAAVRRARHQQVQLGAEVDSQHRGGVQPEPAIVRFLVTTVRDGGY